MCSAPINSNSSYLIVRTHRNHVAKEHELGCERVVYTGRGIALLALSALRGLNPKPTSRPPSGGCVSGRWRASFHEAQAQQKAQD